MAAARIASPASSESSLSFQPTSRHVLNLSFRQQVESCSDDSDDEFELSLPDDDDSESGFSPQIQVSRRTSNYYRRSTSVWSSDRLLAIEENARQEAASALVRLKQTSIDSSASFHSEFVDHLSNIFALANLHLESAQKRTSTTDQQSSALQSSLKTRHQEFEEVAQASISQFLAEQQRIHDAEEAARKKVEKEREEAIRLEAERAEKQRQAEQAARQAEQAAREAKIRLEQESALDKERAAAVENDTSTLWPLEQLKSASSLARFCKKRAEMFSALDEQARNAPFNPDKQLFLECNEVLSRFVPSADAVTSTVKDITAILSKAPDRQDIHLCNLAVSYLKQVQNKVFQNPSLALGFARLWKALGDAMPRSAIVIMGGFFNRCPPTCLNLEPPEQGHNPAQSGSLRALLRVFCCFIQRSDEQASDFAWCWLSGICTSTPTVMTSPCILTFFEVSQILKFKFFQRYGRQGQKLIMYIAQKVLPLLPTAAGGLSSDVENLKTFLDVTSLKKIPERSYVLSCLQNI